MRFHRCLEEGTLEYNEAFAREPHGEEFRDEWWRCVCGREWTAADLERERMSREANETFREAREQATGGRVRRGPDDEACELCMSDVADFVCCVCEKYTCSACTVRYAHGTYCLEHRPAETEAA